jgi:hypothetical protein
MLQGVSGVGGYLVELSQGWKAVRKKVEILPGAISQVEELQESSAFHQMHGYLD